MIEIGKVISSNPGAIHVLMNRIEDFERNKQRLKCQDILPSKMEMI